MKKTYIILLLLMLAMLPSMAQKHKKTAKRKAKVVNTQRKVKKKATPAKKVTPAKIATTAKAVSPVIQDSTAVTAADSIVDSTVHVDLLGVALNAPVQEMLDEMDERGIDFIDVDSTNHVYFLTGTLSGMEVDVEIHCNKDLTKMNYVKLSTPLHTAQNTHHPLASNQRHDFDKMLRWLHHEYDVPDWDGTVRGHRFCRWFSDYDHDIVMIATGRGNTEVYFYENHDKRNIDYYAILKYCERNPAPDVPMLTADESITWKRNDSIVVKRKHVTKKRYKRHSVKKRKGTKRRNVKRKTAKRKTTVKRKRR